MQILTARTAGGWNVTLINDLGVTKEPSTPVVVDQSKSLTVSMSFREGFGSLSAVWETTDGIIRVLPVENGTVNLVIEPGEVRVVGLEQTW